MILVPWRDTRAAYRRMLHRDPCSYCGGRAGTFDHIVPRALRGVGGVENLTAACEPCNARKGPMPLLLWLLTSTLTGGMEGR